MKRGIVSLWYTISQARHFQPHVGSYERGGGEVERSGAEKSGSPDWVAVLFQVGLVQLCKYYLHVLYLTVQPHTTLIICSSIYHLSSTIHHPPPPF
jgi:hypothetical protein